MYGGGYSLENHLEMGWGMYYKIDNSWDLSILSSLVFNDIPIAGGSWGSAPNIFVLNLSYRFKIVY